MPMHPECRQQHLASLNLNSRVPSFLMPGSTMRARQIYLKEHYTDPLEAERAERRDRESADRMNLWLTRRSYAQAEGRPFREPLPGYRSEPMPRWEKILGRSLVWIDDLPMGNVITIILIVLFVLLTFPITAPICCYAINRDWRRMLQRDYDYSGSSPCEVCGRLLAESLGREELRR